MFYQCQRCGNCCRWPGHVKLVDEDITKMAAHFEMTEKEFIDQYTELHPSREALSLINKENGECIFLEGVNICRVQDAKPVQCKGFPNTWNFDGWRDMCEAIPVVVEEKNDNHSSDQT